MADSEQKATLVAVTDEARRALGAEEVRVVTGSFKFGRERRSAASRDETARRAERTTPRCGA